MSRKYQTLSVDIFPISQTVQLPPLQSDDFDILNSAKVQNFMAITHWADDPKVRIRNINFHYAEIMVS